MGGLPYGTATWYIAWERGAVVQADGKDWVDLSELGARVGMCHVRPGADGARTIRTTVSKGGSEV